MFFPFNVIVECHECIYIKLLDFYAIVFVLTVCVCGCVCLRGVNEKCARIVEGLFFVFQFCADSFQFAVVSAIKLYESDSFGTTSF